MLLWLLVLAQDTSEAVPLVSAGRQRGTLTCLGTADNLTCSRPDGARYVERRQGDGVVRRGTEPDGSTWTERVTPVLDGTRTEGYDSSGNRWYQRCSPKFGVNGTNRQGETVFEPPQRPRPAERNAAGQVVREAIDPCNAGSR